MEKNVEKTDSPDLVMKNGGYYYGVQSVKNQHKNTHHPRK